MTGSTILKVSLLILSLGCKREDNDFDVYNPYYIQGKYESYVKSYLKTHKNDSIEYSIGNVGWYLNNSNILDISCDKDKNIESTYYYFPYANLDFLSSVSISYYKIDEKWVTSAEKNDNHKSVYEFKSVKYNSDGLISEDSCTLSNPYLKRKNSFFYNHKKQLIRKEQVSTTSRLPYRTLYEYGLDGQLKQEHSYFEPNQNQDEEVINYYYKFIPIDSNEKVKITYQKTKYIKYDYSKDTLSR